jgi:hypothetical protein
MIDEDDTDSSMNGENTRRRGNFQAINSGGHQLIIFKGGGLKQRSSNQPSGAGAAESAKSEASTG